jgi:hypothetical protein
LFARFDRSHARFTFLMTVLVNGATEGVEIYDFMQTFAIVGDHMNLV